MDNAIWDAKNTPQASDGTAELIRKHKIFKAQWDKIVSGKVQRGQDYWGGVDDSIANDLTECDELLCERAIMQHDRDAGNYIMEANQVEIMWWIQQKLATVKEAVEALESFVPNEAAMLLEPIVQKLKSILPSPYPTSGDENEDSEDD